MSITNPGWLDEPGHDDPVALAQALGEWATTHPHPDGTPLSAGDVEPEGREAGG